MTQIKSKFSISYATPTSRVSRIHSALWVTSTVLGLAWLLTSLFLGRLSFLLIGELRDQLADRASAARLVFRALTPAEIADVEREAMPIDGWSHLTNAQRVTVEQILGNPKQHLLVAQSSVSGEPRSSPHIPQRIIIFPGNTAGGVEVQTDGGSGVSGEMQIDAAGRVVSAQYDDVGRNQTITVTGLGRSAGRIAPQALMTRFAAATTAAVLCGFSALLSAILLIAGYRSGPMDTKGLKVQRFCAWGQITCSVLLVAGIAWIAESQFGFTGGSVLGDVILLAAASLATCHPISVLVLTSDIRVDG